MVTPSPFEAPLPGHPTSEPAFLLLEDGRRFDGVRIGAAAEATGEVVFNTSMVGYQEVLTDPSYSGQIVAMTYPLMGNYGVNTEDEESPAPQAEGFVVREVSRGYSSWRGRESLHAYLERHGVPGIAEVDTRALTRHLRSHGAMRGALASADADLDEVRERIRAHPPMEGLDLACGVSTDRRYEVPAHGRQRFRVWAYDFGVKARSPHLLAERGCHVTIIPATTTPDEIEEADPDGLFVSNGPGDPAAVQRAQDVIRRVAARGTPIFGICLGHQLVTRAFGGSTFKLPFGHHGGNHPVRNLDRGTVEITAQNHGFAVEKGEGTEIPGAPDLRLTHLNLYDGTVEGVAHRSLPVFSVQYHPEAAPGPHDSRYLFDAFVERMAERAENGKRHGATPGTP